MKYKKTSVGLAVLLLLLLGGTFSVYAQQLGLPEQFLKHFEVFVKGRKKENFTKYFNAQDPQRLEKVDRKEGLTCYSTLDFSLHQDKDEAVQRDWREVKNLYQKHMNDLWNDAFETARYEIDREVEVQTGQDIQLTEPYTAKARGSTLLATQNQQEKNGLKTRCTDSHNKYPHAPCRVTETVLAQWCGYQLFLETILRDGRRGEEVKERYRSILEQQDELIAQFYKNAALEKGFDQESFRAESQRLAATSRELLNKDELSHAQRLEAEAISRELEKSHQALLDTLELYRHYEQSYRLHQWLTHINYLQQSSKDSLNNKLSRYRESFYKFPEKFVNSTAIRCD